MSGHGPGEWHIALASVADAEAMAALYREAYPTAPGLPTGSGYPFPQYMDGAWLADSLSASEFCWLVAKRAGELIGCLGAATNISLPSDDDRVAELTGLVVSKRCRGKGIGQSLLKAMCRELEGGGAFFLLAETRTGNLGGFKGTVKAGFIPIGFEPFAHDVVGQYEHMIMMGKLLSGACESRTLHYRTSPVAHRLGSACLRLLRQPMPPCQPAAAYPLEFANKPSDPRLFTRLNTDFGLSGDLDFCRGPLIVERITSTLYEVVSAGLQGHRSGVVGLRRIQGLSREELRFLDLHYAMRQQNEVLGVARVSVDLQDRRARVLQLGVQFDGLQAFFLRRVLYHIQGEEPLQQLACAVVDVRADFVPLHASLQAMGFFPTVYYPAFVATEAGRVDAVQFTRIFGEDLHDVPEPVSELGPDVTDIIRIVLASRNQVRGDSQKLAANG